MNPRTRIDRLLVERGLFESRAKAQAAIAAGRVTADDVLITKPSQDVAAAAILHAEPAHPYVSRGGVKLQQHSIIPLRSDVRPARARLPRCRSFDRRVHRGPARARGPTGLCGGCRRGQLHPRLRAHPEIVSIEDTDIRRLDPALLPERPDFITIDASFISLKLVLPAVIELARRGHLMALIKPQFEAGRRLIKNGIVRDPLVHSAVCDDIASFVASRGWHVRGIVPSPISGTDGNREFFIAAHQA